MQSFGIRLPRRRGVGEGRQKVARLVDPQQRRISREIDGKCTGWNRPAKRVEAWSRAFPRAQIEMMDAARSLVTDWMHTSRGLR